MQSSRPNPSQQTLDAHSVFVFVEFPCLSGAFLKEDLLGDGVICMHNNELITFTEDESGIMITSPHMTHVIGADLSVSDGLALYAELLPAHNASNKIRAFNIIFLDLV